MNKKEQLVGVDGIQSAKCIANNTLRVKYVDGRESIRLHLTDVLTFTPDKKCIYNTGGWKTATTKQRINRYAPVCVEQKRGVWYIGGRVYQDGCYVRGGKVYGAKPPKRAITAEREVKRVREYCREYISKFFAYEIPAPSNGDCWACLMKAEDGTRPLSSDGSHVRMHIKEKYFVPSLLVAACEAFPVANVAKSMFAYAWNPAADRKEATEWITIVSKRQMESSLYRYCKRQLGMVA